MFRDLSKIKGANIPWIFRTPSDRQTGPLWSPLQRTEARCVLRGSWWGRT